MAGLLESLQNALGIGAPAAPAPAGYGAGMAPAAAATTPPATAALKQATSTGVLARKQRYDKYVIDQQMNGQEAVPIDQFAAQDTMAVQ